MTLSGLVRCCQANKSHRYLALVCIMGDDNPMDNKVLIDYNVGVFQEALAKVFQW